jgi:acyl-CoA synthetase (AMP-forming)/AMP-acid ligase II
VRIEDLLRRNAVQRADEVALIDDRRQLTWSELNGEANRLANAFLANEYGEQERVAVVLSNSCDLPVVFYGLWKCNLVSVAINPRLTESEVRRILEHSGASVVFCESEAVVAAASGLPSMRDIVSVGGALAGARAFEHFLGSVSDEEPPRIGCGDDLRSLRYTSGTTGRPKGCMATHAQQLASVTNFLVEVKVPRTGPSFLSVPMTLGVGAFYLTAAAYLGVPLLIRKRFDAKAFRADVEKHGVVHAFLVPTMLIDLVRGAETEGPWQDAPLGMIGYGGATISWEVIRALREIVSVDLYQGLGATEAGGFATLMTPGDHDRMLARDELPSLVPVGRQAAYARARVVDESGDEVERGVPGEFQISSASTFSGYWAQPDETRRVMKDGWLRLGDIAFQDDEGYIYLVDRKQGVIRSGSQNVYAAEVEAVVQSCPGVFRAAVVGVPDERFGALVKALVQREEGAELTEQEIIAFCEERLANYKRPRFVQFVEAIPVDDAGKVKRPLLASLTQNPDPR